jgi:hypothetical protein
MEELAQPYANVNFSAHTEAPEGKYYTLLSEQLADD